MLREAPAMLTFFSKFDGLQQQIYCKMFSIESAFMGVLQHV